MVGAGGVQPDDRVIAELVPVGVLADAIHVSENAQPLSLQKAAALTVADRHALDPKLLDPGRADEVKQRRAGRLGEAGQVVVPDDRNLV